MKYPTVVATAALLTLSGCVSIGPLADTEPVAFDRQAALASVNAYRAENGLAPLAEDRRLTQAAATQSAAMAARDKMDHGVAGRLSGRVESAGYAWSTTAENIGKGYASYDAAMAGWIASTGHRRNLLNPAVTEIGFAGARDRRGGRPYWTQIFAAPKREGPARGGPVPSG